ncbi:MAG: phosphodiester glycosidase family protein [Lachnospirales bacterium]
MKKGLKRVIGAIVSMAFIISSCANAFAYGSLLYENKEVQTITRGLTYEKSTRMYPEGWLDVYMLTIDASEPDLAVQVIDSVDSIGAKASVEKLAKDNGVIAAVNGDFFGSGTKKSSMGQVAADGQMKAVQNYYNGSTNKYAGLFIDSENVPFIDYVKSSIGFHTSDYSIVMGAKNKVTDFSKPVYFDKTAISSTSSIDSSFSGLYKIKVKDNVITYISGKGEVVSLDDCDYIIVMNTATANSYLKNYSVGMSVNYAENEVFQFRPSKSISTIKFGISGGGELLRNGEYVATGEIIGPNARNPRTLVGVNQDKSKIFICCIDGRKNGLGATHQESAQIMKEYGCYDAIHMDGGGSTTMVVREEDKKDLSVVNIPSEGSQRAVANGIGIKATGEAWVLQRIKAYTSGDNYLFKGVENPIYVNAYDGQLNEMSVDVGKLSFSSSLKGEWIENKFKPSEEGKGTITVTYGDVSDTMDITVLKGASAIRVTADNYSLDVGESTNLKAVLINKDGYSLDTDTKLDYSVDNSDVGFVKNGVFTATGEGIATIKVTADEFGVSSKLTISVGKKHIAIQSFESGRDIVMYYYPEDSGISGNSEVVEGVSIDGKCSLKIDYNFSPNKTTTQVVYAGLEKRVLKLPQGASDIILWYKGDGSNNQIKVALKDANGNTQNIEIAFDLNSTEWKMGKGSIPKNMVEPIKVDKIYVSSLSTDSDNTQGSVYVDNMSVLAPTGEGGGDLENVSDYMNTDLSSKDGEVVSVFGRTKGGNTSLVSNVVTNMANGSRAIAFAGDTNISNNTGVPAVIWNNSYTTNNTDNFSFVTLATGNGSLRVANADQWRYIRDYCYNLSKKNIVVLMDKYLWSGVSDSREQEALHQIFKNAIRDYGKNIIVVSSVGESDYVELKDGVRYVNLSGVAGSDTKYLKLKGNSEEMFYEFVSVLN